MPYHRRYDRYEQDGTLAMCYNFPSLCDKGMSKVATFDGTAYYLQWDYSAALALRQAAPWAKLVIILQEPITRAMSWLQHMNMKFPLVPNCLVAVDGLLREAALVFEGEPPSRRVVV